jgi:Ca2+-binding EF-hand superfamily protein
MYSYEWRKFLNENQKKEIKDTFKIFDKNNSNRMDFSDLKPAMMALGFNFTQEDIERMLYSLKKSETEKEYLNLENFLDLIGMRMVKFLIYF